MNMSEEVTVYLLREYTAGIRFYYLDNPDDELPPQMSVFDDEAVRIRHEADERGELNVLRQLFDVVLRHDDEWLLETVNMDLTEIIDTEPAQLEETLKAILLHIYAAVWGDAPRGDFPEPNVVLSKTPISEWRALRES